MIYEVCQDQLNNHRQYNPVTHCISGAAAGGIAAAVTTPLDVCKTILNTQHPCKRKQPQLITGLVHACQTIYQVILEYYLSPWETRLNRSVLRAVCHLAAKVSFW